jgi:hypothetical protein
MSLLVDYLHYKINKKILYNKNNHIQFMSQFVTSGITAEE